MTRSLPRRILDVFGMLVMSPYIAYRVYIDMEKFRRWRAATEVCLNCEDDFYCEQHQWERTMLIRHRVIRPMYWDLWPRNHPVVTSGIPLPYRAAVSGYGGESDAV